jgi:hypothetical protein
VDAESSIVEDSTVESGGGSTKYQRVTMEVLEATQRGKSCCGQVSSGDLCGLWWFMVIYTEDIHSPIHNQTQSDTMLSTKPYNAIQKSHTVVINCFLCRQTLQNQHQGYHPTTTTIPLLS